MIWTYRIDKTHNLIIIKMIGDVDSTEMKKAYDAIYNDSEFSTDFVVLMDKTDLRQNVVNYEIIQREKKFAIASLAPFIGTRIAVLHGNYNDYGIGRQWQVALDDLDVEFRNFVEETEAKAWLNLPEDYV
ncbi:MAG: hypothetical protein V7727_20640, partial [Sneathiella sp.]